MDLGVYLQSPRGFAAASVSALHFLGISRPAVPVPRANLNHGSRHHIKASSISACPRDVPCRHEVARVRWGRRRTRSTNTRFFGLPRRHCVLQPWACQVRARKPKGRRNVRFINIGTKPCSKRPPRVPLARYTSNEPLRWGWLRWPERDESNGQRTKKRRTGTATPKRFPICCRLPGLAIDTAACRLPRPSYDGTVQ